MSWIVHKFGGTSVGGADRYEGVARLIKDLHRSASGGAKNSGKTAVVVSAMKGVTDALLGCVDQARKKDDGYLKSLEKLRALHFETASKLVSGSEEKALHERIDSNFKDLQDVLRGVWQARTASESLYELVSGFGEVWSAQLLNALLKKNGFSSDWLDAREVLVVDSFPHSVNVRWEESQKKIDDLLAQKKLKKNEAEVLVITGYVASTPEGVPTTLKRNGSDFSASIFGVLLKSSEIVIWTDVDGVLSADPRLVPDALVLNELSYQEVSELAYFGAKVVHPATMEPAFHAGIPIRVRNTFNPAFPGTLIHKNAKSEHPVKGFSAIDQMALISVEGTGMVGVPGVAERLFGSLRAAGISITLISQASSEHSICLAVPAAQAEAAKKAIEQTFFAEIQQDRIQSVSITPNCSILAAVGDGMVHQPGVAGRFFSALGHAGVNILAIAQGSSERNISAVISGGAATKALRTVHSAFMLSNQTLSVGVIGTGLIGGTFLKQLKKQLAILKSERQIDVRVRGILNSKKMLLDDRSIDLDTYTEQLASQGEKSDLKKFAEHIRSGHLPHGVIIDATASAEIPLSYPEWLRSGLHVITPNKKANTSTFARYTELKTTSQNAHRHFLYSTNVGAGLPVIQTLKELHRTGDRVLQIEGVLSGTLSYILNSFTGEKPFSKIVEEAKALGYTEPDPRDDLSGMDVARKLVILAREMGLPIELEQVSVESLVPAALAQGTAEDYLKRLPEHDGAMLTKLEEAKKQGGVLRYVARIDNLADEKGKASVKLTACPLTHPLSRLTGSDNMVMYRTERYDKQPLVIQGPGAGPEVTAAGVFADLLRLAAYVGAPS
jgi:aspartokinase/homoserine dehydrogenase 1